MQSTYHWDEFLTWHTDSGHGWLAVPQRLMVRLGLANQISKYSYYDPESRTAFLEEDCDAPLFISAAAAAGIHLILKERVYTGDAPIRKLPRF